MSADRAGVYEDLRYKEDLGRVFFKAKQDCAAYDALAVTSPFDVIVTLTASDPGGANVQVTGTFRVIFDCPELRSATVDGATLTLTWDETLDTASEPASSAFTVKVDDTEVSLAAGGAVAIDGKAVTLTLAAAVSAGQSVTVSYVPPDGNPIQDPDGYVVAGFTDEEVINITGDGTAPVFQSASVEGDTLTLTWTSRWTWTRSRRRAPSR